MNKAVSDGFGFDQVIAPLSRASFLESYYEAKPLVLHRQDRNFYRDLLTLDQVWDYIETRCPAAGEIKMIKLGAGQPETAWTGAQHRADPVRVAELFDEGWTIGLNKMHERLPALATMCAAAEAVFSAPFQTNLYLTPPGAQGFQAHWDTHDVFVLQIHGSKDWTLYDTKIELPLVGQSFDDEKPPPGPVSAAFTLEAGDLLYCPRGLMHSAESTDESSLHITFGLIGRTWADLLIEVLSEVALREPCLRRNLPVGFARHDFDETIATAEFGRVLDAVVNGTEFPDALAAARDQFVAGRTRRLPGHVRGLARADGISEHSRVRARPHLILSLKAVDEDFVVSCGGSVLTLPGFTEAAVRASMSGDAFRVSDLPGPLDTSGKVTLARRLLREGLLQPDD